MPIDLRNKSTSLGGIDLRSPQKPLDEETFQNTLLPERASFARGLRQGAAGLTAGQLASEAFSAEKAGQTDLFRSKLARAHEVQDEAAKYAPRVNRAEDVHGVRDALDLAAGVVGQGLPTMVPPLIGALAFRGRNPITGYLGAAAPGVAIERADQLLAQYNDPVQAAKPIDLRGNVAMTKGLAAGALEAVVPAGLARVPGARRLTDTVAGTMLGEAATELGQEETGIRAEKYLNPERDTSEDVSRRLNAAVAGGLTGGAVHMGAKVPNVALDAASRLVSAGKESAGDVKEYLTKALPGRITDAKDKVAHTLQLGDADLTLFDSDPVEYGRKLGEAAATRAKAAAEMAKEFGTGLYEKYKGDFSSDAAQQEVAGMHFKQKAAQKAAQMYSDFEELWKKGAGVAKGVSQGIQEGVKKNAQAPEATYQNILSVLESNMKPDFLDNPDTVEHVRKIARHMAGFAGGQLTDEQIQGISRLTNMFTDPSATFDQLRHAIGSPELTARVLKQAPARMDALDPDSVLRKAMTKEADDYLFDNPDAVEELGGIIDKLITQGLGENEKQALVSLVQVFGSREKLNDVLNYYAEAHGKKLGRERTVLEEDMWLDDANGPALEEERNPDLPEPNVETRDLITRAYHFKSIGEENEPFMNRAEARLLRMSGKQRGDVVPVSEMLKDLGHSLAPSGARLRAKLTTKINNIIQQSNPQEIAKRREAVRLATTPELREAAQKRLDYSLSLRSGKAKSELQRMLDKAEEIRELPDEAVTSRFYVLKDTGTPTNEFELTDSEFASMRTLQDTGKRRDKAADEKRKATLFAVVTKTGKTLNVSAESVWKTWRDKMRREGVEPPRDESKKAFTARMFMEGLAALRLRPDIDKIDPFGPGLLIDRDLGLTWKQINIQRKRGPSGRVVYTHEGQHLPFENPMASTVADIGMERDTFSPGVEKVGPNKWDDSKAIERKTKSGFRPITRRTDTGSVPVKDEAKAKEQLVSQYAKAGSPLTPMLERYATGEQRQENLPGGAVRGRQEQVREDKSPEPKLEPRELARERTPREHKLRAATMALLTLQKKLNAENPATPQEPLTAEQREAAIAEIVKRRGKDIKVVFDDTMLDSSGSYDPSQRLITIALGVGSNLMNVVRHEALHDLFATVNGADPKQRKTWEQVKVVLSRPYVQNQLKRLLKDHPQALEAALRSPEESAAYAYQFWAEGKLTVGPDTQHWFTRIQDFFRRMFKILTEEEKVEKLMIAFDAGKFSEISTAGAVLRDLQFETFKDKLERVAQPVAELAETLFTGATDQLRNMAFEPLTEIADEFYREADREKGSSLPFIQAVTKNRAIFMNRVARAIGDASREDIKKAWQGLVRNETQEGRAGEIQQSMRKVLDDLFEYMDKAGVARLEIDPETKAREWKEIRRVQNYFPRAWNPYAIRNNRNEFMALLKNHGNLSVDQALTVYNALTAGDGQIELAENEHHLGYTPYAAHLQERGLKFINPRNVQDFEKFMDDDLVNTMSTYIVQAAHRAEYARKFGNAGERIREALDRAEQMGATEKELARASKIIRGLEGTLNHRFSPELRQLFNTLVTYQNVVLLPFALVNSLVDPMGVAVRSGDWKEAWLAAMEGFRGLGLAMTGQEKNDEKRRIVEDLGIIDNTLQLAVLGDVYSGPYMSRWLKNVNEKFFRWNGMSIWNDRMRIAAVAAGERFILRHAEGAAKGNETSKRYMEELGLEGYKPTGDTLDLGDPKVKDALFKFVDGAVLRPNAAHRPTWGSDPMWQLIFHLKQFTFSFQNTILRRGLHEMRHGNTMPYTMIASYVPFAMLTGTLKGAMLGNLPANYGPIDALMKGVAQSGVMGTGNFGHEAWADAAMGGVPGQSFAGPTIGHGIDIAQTLAGSRDSSLKDLFLRSVPLSPLAKAVQ